MKVTPALLDAIRAAGVTVVEMPGWQDRGETDGPFAIKAILLHHDAMGLDNDNVAIYMSQDGVNGAQFWIKRTGELYVLAAGRKWHAGIGGGWGSIPANSGNSVCLGIETDYSGTGPRDPRIDATVHKVTSVVVQFHGLDPARDLALHREYAPGRKNDLSNFDPNDWRARAGNPPPSPPPPDPEVFPDMDAQTFKQLVRDGVKWALEDPAIDPIIIRGIVQQELSKMLSGGPADFQAFKQAVHDGTAWALEDPAVDVSRFPKA